MPTVFSGTASAHQQFSFWVIPTAWPWPWHVVLHKPLDMNWLRAAKVPRFWREHKLSRSAVACPSHNAQQYVWRRMARMGSVCLYNCRGCFFPHEVDYERRLYACRLEANEVTVPWWASVGPALGRSPCGSTLSVSGTPHLPLHKQQPGQQCIHDSA